MQQKNQKKAKKNLQKSKNISILKEYLYQYLTKNFSSFTWFHFEFLIKAGLKHHMYFFPGFSWKTR